MNTVKPRQWQTELRLHIIGKMKKNRKKELPIFRNVMLFMLCSLWLFNPCKSPWQRLGKSATHPLMPSPNLRGMKRTSRARVGPVVYQSHTDLGQQEGLILQVTLDTCQEPESGCSRQRLGPTNEVCRWEVGEAS